MAKALKLWFVTSELTAFTKCTYESSIVLNQAISRLISFVTEKQLSKSGEIKDPVVNEYCSREILHYMDMINRHDVSQYTITELINFLLKSEEEVCFSDYATQFISRMINEGHERNI